MKNSEVVIYDPNWINPYGVELASIIEATGRTVTFWCTKNRNGRLPRVQIHPALQAGDRNTMSKFKLFKTRLLIPAQLVLSTPRSTPLIVIWTRDFWDASLFALRCALGGKLIFIYHNPASVRSRPGWAGKLERLLIGLCSTTVVHSQRLAGLCQTQNSGARVRVAAHPPYSITTGGFTETSRLRPSSPPVIAFVGALRPDKGVNDLLSIASRVTHPWRLRILGPGKLPAATTKELGACGVTCEYIGSGSGPTDAELVAGLKEADVMIAPYKAVTESGSVHMALSLNVPVLAYESPGMEHIVNKRSMASGPTELGETLNAYLERPWNTFTPGASKLHAACCEDWENILNEPTR